MLAILLTLLEKVYPASNFTVKALQSDFLVLLMDVRKLKRL